MKGGFLIPDDIYPDDFACVVFKIPNDPLYRQAVRGHIWELARWYRWEQTTVGDTRASQVATLFRVTLLDTLEIKADCNDAIESILPEGTIVASLEELCEAVYCGNMKSAETIAQRILLAIEESNIKNPVEVGTGAGEVTVKDDASGSDPIPGTTSETYFGGVYNQALQFKKLIDGINDNITTGFTVDTIVSLSRIIINPLDLAAWSSLVTSYETTDPQVDIDESALALYFFCNGVGEGISKYAQDVHAASEIDLNYVIDFAQSVPESTWSKWLDAGEKTPRTGYEAADCYRYPLASYEMDVSNFNTGFVEWDTRAIAGHNHRLQIKVIEPFSDGAGKFYDGVWFKNGAAAPTSTYQTRLVSSAGQILPASLLQAYKPDGGTYILEYIVPGVLTGTWFNNVSIVPVSGQIILTLYDLGAI